MDTADTPGAFPAGAGQADPSSAADGCGDPGGGSSGASRPVGAEPGGGFFGASRPVGAEPGGRSPATPRQVSPAVTGVLGAMRPSAAASARAGAPESAAALFRLLGGARGMLDSGVPGAVFVAGYVTTRNLTTPLLIAAGAALVIFVYRLARRDALRYAVSGFAGVGIAAGLAVLTGRPENYFLPALALNAGYAAASALSLALRWPLIGLVLGAVLGEGTQWRRDRPRRRAYSAATMLWMCMFALRIAVLFPLWLANLLVPLAIGRIVLGYPLYALVVWLTWLIISRTRPVRPDPVGTTDPVDPGATATTADPVGTHDPANPGGTAGA